MSKTDCQCCTCQFQSPKWEGCARCWGDDPVAKETQDWINSWAFIDRRKRNGYGEDVDHDTGFGCPPEGVPPCPGRESR